ncbi:hypothetical protein EDB19DRAFT_200790 [Suillus lakei]|nr:hypothetical protein EDB19DRAFT_200790 [Suillus lakei]
MVSTVNTYEYPVIGFQIYYPRSPSPPPIPEASLVYTAEASLNINDDPYSKFRYTPHYGEPPRAKKRPTIFLFRWTRSPAFTKATKQDLSLFALSLARPTQSSVLFAQATFATEDTIFTNGHEHTKDGRLLSARGCFNRPFVVSQSRRGLQILEQLLAAHREF